MFEISKVRLTTLAPVNRTPTSTGSVTRASRKSAIEQRPRLGTLKEGFEESNSKHKGHFKRGQGSACVAIVRAIYRNTPSLYRSEKTL